MAVQVTIDAQAFQKQRLGYCALSLDSLVATTAVVIKSGSKIEVAGAVYDFTADETESGGTWAGIGASNTVYIYIVPAGASTTWIYSTTAPTWDLAKQGFYSAGTSRCVAMLWKDAGGNYTAKKLIVSLNVSRQFISASGALGTLACITDTDYALTAASTATLPSVAMPGCRITFKSKGNFTSTISANAGQTIGTTSSASFVLYAQEDYVTLEWDGVSIWYVVATNGPVQKSDQTAATSTATLSAWTAIGNGLSLGSIPPGIYDLEMDCVGNTLAGGGTVAISIGNGTTPISCGFQKLWPQ